MRPTVEQEHRSELVVLAAVQDILIGVKTIKHHHVTVISRLQGIAGHFLKIRTVFVATGAVLRRDKHGLVDLVVEYLAKEVIRDDFSGEVLISRHLLARKELPLSSRQRVFNEME